MCWIGDGHFFVTIKVSNMTIPHVGHIPLAQYISMHTLKKKKEN